MTSEIGILNQDCVVLAADSALTISKADGTRSTLDSARKIFTLQHPNKVGMMTFNNYTFMDVTWSAILTSYRDYLQDRSISTLEGYVTSFIKYLNTMNIYTEEAEAKQVLTYTVYLCDSLYSLDKNDSEHIKRIQAKLQRLDDRFKKERMLDIDKNVFISKFGGIIIQAFEQKYKDYLESLEMEFIDGVYDYICSSEMLSNYFTAVIFAGYGKDELFPSLREIHFDGRYCGKIKYRYGWSQVTDPTEDDSSVGAIIPFAQQDVSYSVLKGIDPTLNDLRLEQQYEIRDRLIKKASVYFDDSSKAEEFGNEISREFSSANKEFNEVIENSYMNPIVGMLQALSNEEMGEMAKTLVSLAAFKRKYSGELQTVGGPVDVLSISRADGVVWLSNKKIKDLK